MAIEPFLGTRAQRVFAFTVVATAIVVLTMVAIVFGLVSSNVETSQLRYKTLPCYFALFAFAELFELVITIDALKLRNVIQLVGILLFHLALFVFSILQIFQTKEALVTRPGTSCEGDGYANCSGPDSLFSLVVKFLIVVPCVLGVALVILALTTRALFLEFGWAIFHAVGADRQMKTMYQYYQVMICLLKFDFFCFTGLTMQLIILVLNKDAAEFAITIAAIPVVLILLSMCGIALKREIKWLMGLSLIVMVAAESYFLYKFIRLFTPGSRDRYITTRGTLAIFCVIAFLLLLLTFLVGVRCFMDFDKGLRDSKTKGSRQSQVVTPLEFEHKPPGMSQRMSTYSGGAPLGPRISIE